jgi:PAS domain S-box-containing protein
MEMVGSVDAKALLEASKQGFIYADQLHSEQRPALVLFDVGRSTSYKPGRVNSETRSAAKTIDLARFDRIALYTTNAALVAISNYVMSGKKNSKIFRTKAQAVQWLLHGDRPKESSNFLNRLLATVILWVVAVGVLASWRSGLASDALASSKTMSPSVAVTFLLLGLTPLFLRRGKKGADRRLLASLIAGCSALFSLIVLLCLLLQTRTQFSSQLYNVWLNLSQYPDLQNSHTAIGLLLCSLLVVLALRDRPWPWQQHGFHIVAAWLLSGSLLSVLARVYGVPQLILFPLSTSIAFLVLTYGLHMVMKPVPVMQRLGKTLEIYWQALAVFFVVVVLSGVVWQSVNTILKEANLSVPPAAITVGLILLGIIALLVLNQVSLRHRLLQLASRMNEDLEIERNAAVAVQQKDEAILGSIVDAVFAIDVKGKITLFNETIAHMTGHSMADAMGQHYQQVVPFVTGEDPKPFYGFVERVMAGRARVEHAEINMLTKTGPILAGATASAITVDRHVTGAIVVVRDITHEKEVDRMKTEFISLASHQLRTPLSAIKWFSELLLGGDAGKLKPDQAEFTRNIADSAERMIELVNSLLNISRMESGRIMVDPVPTDLKELVGGIVTDLKAKTEERKQTLIVSVHQGLPAIKLDPRLIGQVYLNLLTNAIKYSPKGGEITVFISRKDDNIISQVSDNGYGIPKAQQDHVFQKFFRAENITKIETDGTGLGLYLIKSIIESSGGEIWFKSEEGKGTSFWFSIPMSGMKARKGEVTLDG